MPPKSQKRVVVESRETRLSKMKHKDKAGLEKLVAGTTSPGEPPLGHGRPLSAKKKGMPGMSKKGDARRKAAAEAKITRVTAATRFDDALAQLPDPSAHDGATAPGGVVNNEGAVLSRSAGILLERAAETARAMELLKSSMANRSPAVVVAASGAGKSTFLAHLVSQIRTGTDDENRFDTVLAVFVGATDGSTSIYRICTDLLAALRRAGELDDGSDNADEGGDSADFQGLVAKLGSRLRVLGAAGHRTCLLFDAVNELDGAHAARSLRWLPAQLPDGCSVLISTIGDKTGDATMINSNAGDESVREIMTSLRTRWSLGDSSVAGQLLGKQGSNVMFLPTLSEADRIDLLCQLVVANGGTPLEPAESQAALKHEDSISPLYLKLLAQSIVTSEAMGEPASERLEAIGSYPPTIAAVFDAMLRKLDSSTSTRTTNSTSTSTSTSSTSTSTSSTSCQEDCDGISAASVVLSAVHCSQGGLYEQQLQQLLLDDDRVSVSGPKAVAEVGMLWGALVEAGLPSIVRLQEGCKTTQLSAGETSGLAEIKPVGFVHMQARDAVKRRYLADDQGLEREHKRLGVYFGALLRAADAVGERKPAKDVLLGPSTLGAAVWRQCLRRVPLHHTLSCDWVEVAAFLCSIQFVEAKATAGLSHELLEDYDRAIGLIRASDSITVMGILQPLEDFRDFVRRSQHILSQYPTLARQLALNERDGSAAAMAASSNAQSRKPQTEGDSRGRCDLSEVTCRWLNKPQVRPACVRTFTGFGGLVWALDVSRDGRVAAIGGSDKCIHVIELATGLEIATLLGHTDDITFCCFNPVDESVIISAADKDPLFCWSVSSSAMTSKIALGGDCNGLAWSMDGQFVCSISSATAARQKILRVYEIEKGVLTWQAVLANDSYSCAFGPDGKIACGDGQIVRIWDATAPRMPAAENDTTPVRDSDSAVKLVGHRAGVRAVAWVTETPGKLHRQLLASSSADETVRIWDVHKHACISVLAPGGIGIAEEVISLCFDPSGRLLTASSDKTLRLWAFDEAVQAVHMQAQGQAQMQQEVKPAAEPQLEASNAAGHTTESAEVESAGDSDDDDEDDGESEVALPRSFDAGGWIECAVMRGHSNGLRRVCALALSSTTGGTPAPAAPAAGTSALTSFGALSAADDGSVRLWSLDEASTAGTPWGHAESITACAWCTREGQSVVVSADGKGHVQCQPHACDGAKDDGCGSQRAKLCWRVKIDPVSSSCEAISAMVACDGRMELPSASSPSSSSCSSMSRVACAMYQQCVVLSVQDGSILSRLTFGDWANTCCSLSFTTSNPDSPYGLSLLVAGGDSGTLAMWRAKPIEATEQQQHGGDRWQDTDVEDLEGVSGDIMCCALSLEIRGNCPKGVDWSQAQEQHCWLYVGTNEATVIIWRVGVERPSVQLYKLRLDGEQYGSSWVLSVFAGPVLQQQGQHRQLLGAAVGGRLGATIIWAVPIDSSSDKVDMGDDHVLNLEPYAQRIGGGGIGDSAELPKGGDCKGGIVWGAFVELPRDSSLYRPQQQQGETVQQFPAVVTASTAKTISIWRIRPATSVSSASAGSSGTSSGTSSGNLEMVGLFPASGSFGSPDGIGGQGSIIQMDACEEQKQAHQLQQRQKIEARTRATTKALRTTTLARLAIGDQGGLLYTLALEIEH